MVDVDVEVKVGALIMDPQSGTPIVVLRGVSDEFVLPIWVGTYEAHAIALEIEKNVPQRPMTHDLLRNLIVELGATIERVTITDLRESTFYAMIELRHPNGETTQLDSRPSDAIALALRSSCPIWVRRAVLESAGTSISGNAEKPDFVDDEEGEEWPEVIGESGDLAR